MNFKSLNCCISWTISVVSIKCIRYVASTLTNSESLAKIRATSNPQLFLGNCFLLAHPVENNNYEKVNCNEYRKLIYREQCCRLWGGKRPTFTETRTVDDKALSNVVVTIECCVHGSARWWRCWLAWFIASFYSSPTDKATDRLTVLYATSHADSRRYYANCIHPRRKFPHPAPAHPVPPFLPTLGWERVGITV